MTWNAQPPPPPVWQPIPRRAYTSWIARACAWLFDAIPVVIASSLWDAVAISSSGMDCVTYENGGRACTATPSVAGHVAFAIFAVLSLMYIVWNYGHRQGVKGSSIGKSLLGFKVVSEKSGRPIGFGRSIVRQFAHVVDAAICMVGYLFPLWDGKRQTLADKIMGTVCIPIKPRGEISGRR